MKTFDGLIEDAKRMGVPVVQVEIPRSSASTQFSLTYQVRDKGVLIIEGTIGDIKNGNTMLAVHCQPGAF